MESEDTQEFETTNGIYYMYLIFIVILKCIKPTIKLSTNISKKMLWLIDWLIVGMDTVWKLFPHFLCIFSLHVSCEHSGKVCQRLPGDEAGTNYSR